jgi:hypothetical protein
MNLNINDPAIPAPGEMQMSPVSLSRLQSSTWPVSPVTSSHGRQPSLGELHQELENEQEAQVVSIFLENMFSTILLAVTFPFSNPAMQAFCLFLILYVTANANPFSLRIAYLP